MARWWRVLARHWGPDQQLHRARALVNAMRAALRLFTSAWFLCLVLPTLAAALVVVDWLADLFWFQALGYEAVFWRLRWCQLGLFTAATCVAFVYGWYNLRVLGRHVDLLGTAAHPPSSPIARLNGLQPAASRNLKALLEVFAPLAAAMVVGFGFAQDWDELIRFHWANSMGKVT